MTADWLFRGMLTKLGDVVDSVTGRRWVPSSSLATSQLIERLKKLLDSEGRPISGKGVVVPHNISLKMQWDKFSEDSESAIQTLKDELLAAAADHINDSLYYTLAPLNLDVKTDYFTDGVKLSVSFDNFVNDDQGVEMNVTVPSISVSQLPEVNPTPTSMADASIIARYTINGINKQTKIKAPVGGRISVGRTAESALALDDTSVSKLHASIVIGADGRLSVADTGSTNGTFVNRQRLAYGQAAKINPNDLLRFGSVDVSIKHAEQPPQGVKIASELSDPTHVIVDGFEFRSRSMGGPTDANIVANEASGKQSQGVGNENVVPDSKADREESDPAIQPIIRGSE